LEVVFTKYEDKPLTKGEAIKLFSPLHQQNKFMISKMKKIDRKLNILIDN